MFGKCWNLRVGRFYGPRNMRLKPSDVGEVFITDHFVYLSSIHSLKQEKTCRKGLKLIY